MCTCILQIFSCNATFYVLILIRYTFLIKKMLIVTILSESPWVAFRVPVLVPRPVPFCVPGNILMNKEQKKDAGGTAKGG